MLKENSRILPQPRCLLFAGFLSVLILIGNFFMDNIRYPIFDDVEAIGWFDQLHERRSHFDWDKVLCANVGMDKCLASVTDPFGDSAGAISITDRATLLHFLQTISDAEYQEIFLDVRFPSYAEGLTTSGCLINTDSATDSALFAIIADMPNIVVSHHAGLDANPRIVSKLALADYGATIYTGFSRYELRQHGQSSAALKMYEDVTEKDISPSGYFTSEGRLCHNAIFLRIPHCLLYPTHEVNGAEVVHYPLLSANLMQNYTPDELRILVKDKVVVIGDFEEDLHDTYAGAIPGPMLTYLAYLDLLEGRHKVGTAEWILLLVMMLMLSLRLMNGKSWTEYLPERMKRLKILIFMLSFISWGTVMLALKFAFWIIGGYVMSATLPTLVFACIDEYERYKTEYAD